MLNVSIGFSVAECSVGVGGCWRPVKNGEGRVSLKYKHMQCTCVRCYNFYHPPLPSIYASLTLLSKSRLPYPSIHLSMPVPPLVQVSAALSIHPSNHSSLIPSLAPHPSPTHPAMSPTSHRPSLIHPPSTHPSIHPTTHTSIYPCLSPPCPSLISPIHPCLSHPKVPVSSSHLCNNVV